MVPCRQPNLHNTVRDNVKSDFNLRNASRRWWNARQLELLEKLSKDTTSGFNLKGKCSNVNKEDILSVFLP